MLLVGLEAKFDLDEIIIKCRKGISDTKDYTNCSECACNKKECMECLIKILQEELKEK